MIREFEFPEYLATRRLPRDDPPDWNYTNHGEDWDFNSCKLITFPQSPLNITWTNTTDITTGDCELCSYDWDAYYFSFIPRFRRMMVDTIGIRNFTLKVTLKDDGKGFHGFWGSEPLKADYERLDIIDWQVTEIRFKYPSEHTYNNSRFDMEMQIYVQVSLFDPHIPSRTSIT